VTDELDIACRAFDLEPRELRNVIAVGFKRSFFPGSYRDKRAYVRQVMDHYDRLMAEAGVVREHNQ
jgi:adenosine deaminase